MSCNLSGVEMRAALDTLHAIGQDCVDGGDFARRGVQCLPRLVSSDSPPYRSATSTADTAG